jgi:hypothetical protein
MGPHDEHQLQAAVSRWLHELADDQAPQLPDDLADQIIATVRRGRLFMTRLNPLVRKSK